MSAPRIPRTIAIGVLPMLIVIRDRAGSVPAGSTNSTVAVSRSMPAITWLRAKKSGFTGTATRTASTSRTERTSNRKAALSPGTAT